MLASDFAKLGEEIKRVDEAGCDMIHLDIMDGHFVPNLTFGPPLVSCVRKYSKLIFDTHLMLTDPMKYAGAFIKAGSDLISFHVESNDDPEKLIKFIHESGAEAGITLKPGTQAEKVFPWLDRVEMVLVMTVEPGFGGQSFMKDMMPKVKAIKDEIKKRKLAVQLQVDGGIDATTVYEAAAAGANVMVAGTSVFRNPAGAAKAIADLKAAEKVLYK